MWYQKVKNQVLNGVAFSISSMFYNISTDYPFFMVAFLQIVCFAGIYMKPVSYTHLDVYKRQYQDQLLRLEDKLESGLYCELTDKTLHDGYIEYTLLYDMIANRITCLLYTSIYMPGVDYLWWECVSKHWQSSECTGLDE